jgi:hypothetical protein
MQMLADVQQMAEKLAALRLDKNGDVAEKAARSAVDDLINFKYDFQDNYRIPKDAGVSPAIVQAGVLEAKRLLGDPEALREAPAGLEMFGVTPRPGPLALLPKQDIYERGVGDEYLARTTAQRLRDVGVWVTDPRERGLVLMQPNGDPAKAPDGGFVQLTWKQLEQLGSSKEARARADAVEQLKWTVGATY